MTTHPTRRRTIIIAAAAVGVLAIGGVAAFRVTRDDDPVADAISLLEQESKFDASREAVENLATVHERLVAATRDFPKDCDIDAGMGRCLALNQAASWSLNFATASAACTQPAIQEGRVALLDYLTTTTTMADDATDPPPLPSIPNC